MMVMKDFDMIVILKIKQSISLQPLVSRPSSVPFMNPTRSQSSDMYSETKQRRRSDFSAHTSKKTTRYDYPCINESNSYSVRTIEFTIV